MARVAIAGAGVLGRLLAWHLAHEGHAVSVFDPAPGPRPPAVGHIAPRAAAAGFSSGPPYAAGFTAAGMLSPLAELDAAEPRIAQLGWRSLPLWQGIAARLAAGGAEGLLRTEGSLLLAHGADRAMAQRCLARLAGHAAALPEAPTPQTLDAAQQRALEPALASGLLAWHLPGEGQILPRETLRALAEQAPGVAWHWGRRVASVRPGHLLTDDGREHRADLAIDTRGLGARPELPLRGVRGELLWLHAPGLRLTRPLRLLHPRHRVYLVPRPGERVVVGASEIESEDRSGVSLRSAVELLSAAHSVLPELAEARIEHLESNLRPALGDHLPCVQHSPGLLRLNGLFRHGWLIAPALIHDALHAAALSPLPERLPHDRAHRATQ